MRLSTPWIESYLYDVYCKHGCTSVQEPQKVVCTTELGLLDPSRHVSRRQFEWSDVSMDRLLYWRSAGFWWDSGGTLHLVSVVLGHMWDTVFFINRNEFSFFTGMPKFPVLLHVLVIDWQAMKGILRNRRLLKRINAVFPSPFSTIMSVWWSKSM